MSKPIKKRLKDLPKKEQKRHFYVCSYGGSGSKMFCRYLRRYGHVKHIHSRQPPLYLEKVGTSENTEWFNGIKIDEELVCHYTVIYIYRDPIKAILSRHRHEDRNNNQIKSNLVNIQVPEEYQSISHNNFLSNRKDLYGLEEFFDNYVSGNFNKNYDIYCIKYEMLFEKLSQINKILRIPDWKPKYPTCIEKKRMKGLRESVRFNEIYTPIL